MKFNFYLCCEVFIDLIVCSTCKLDITKTCLHFNQKISKKSCFICFSFFVFFFSKHMYFQRDLARLVQNFIGTSFLFLSLNIKHQIV